MEAQDIRICRKNSFLHVTDSESNVLKHSRSKSCDLPEEKGIFELSSGSFLSVASSSNLILDDIPSQSLEAPHGSVPSMHSCGSSDSFDDTVAVKKGDSFTIEQDGYSFACTSYDPVISDTESTSTNLEDEVSPSPEIPCNEPASQNATSNDVVDAVLRQFPEEEKERTTVMICGIPCRISQPELFVDLRDMGYDFDYLYLPHAYTVAGNLGYAFVNLRDSCAAEHLIKEIKGHRFKQQPNSKKTVSASYASIQGVLSNISSYVNNRQKKIRKIGRPWVCPEITSRKIGMRPWVWRRIRKYLSKDEDDLICRDRYQNV